MKFERTSVWGFEHAIRGMRNPLNSWNKSDSYFEDGEFHLGENDFKLAKSLIKGGSEHRKFLRQIFVSVDITAPLYWWKQFDTYKIGTTANSCSTMHKIAEKEFTLDDFSHEHLMRDNGLTVLSEDVLMWIIDFLNENRKAYLETKNKEFWWRMIQILPSSYNQMRTVTMNYENIYNMIRQRGAHKLDEWSEDFIEWAVALPYSQLLFLEDNNKKVKEMENDPVNHPNHYSSGGIDCIDAMIAAYGKESVKQFCKCNAFKYQWRFDKKNGKEDLDKAQWYQNKFLELSEKGEKQ